MIFADKNESAYVQNMLGVLILYEARYPVSSLKNECLTERRYLIAAINTHRF